MKDLSVIVIAAVVVPSGCGIVRSAAAQASNPRRSEDITGDAAGAESPGRAPRRRDSPELGGLENPRRRRDGGHARDHERMRGRIFRVGTLVLLVAVAAAIVIPTLHKSSGAAPPRPWASSAPSPTEPSSWSTRPARRTRTPSPRAGAVARRRQSRPAFGQDRSSPSSTATGSCSTCPPASSNSPADPGLVQAVADYLGVLKAYQVAGLTPPRPR